VLYQLSYVGTTTAGHNHPQETVNYPRKPPECKVPPEYYLVKNPIRKGTLALKASVFHQSNSDHLCRPTSAASKAVEE
jgi:hypothetical protein